MIIDREKNVYRRINLTFTLITLVISVISLKIASKVLIHILIILTILIFSLKAVSKVYMFMSLDRF